MTNLTFYAKSVFVESDDHISAQVTVNDVDIADVISDAPVNDVLEVLDISDIEAFLKERLEGEQE